MSAQSSPIARQLPNILTTVRLLMVPVFIVLIVRAEGATLAAGLVFLTASLTDFLDGWIARRFHVLSHYGKIVDPLADRLLVNSAVILLCLFDSRWFDGHGRLLGPEFLLVIARDLPGIYGYWRMRDKRLPDVSRVGKLGMALMMAGLTWLLLLPRAHWPLWPFWIGLVISVVAIVQYVVRYRDDLRIDSHRQPPAARVD